MFEKSQCCTWYWNPPIKAMRALLHNLDLQNVVVTADAMHTQRDFVRFLVEEKSAHYVLIVKANQGELEKAIALIGNEDWSVPISSTGKGHGRVEIRTTQTSTFLRDYLCDIQPFPYVEQVFKVCRKVINQKTGVITQERVFGITSLNPQQAGAAEIGTLVRGHWAIENKLHWSRDVLFDEDNSQVRTHFGAQVMASLRNTAISLLRLRGETALAPALRRIARNPHLAIALVCGH
jgi:predicted transposase YbfD/YdcC